MALAEVSKLFGIEKLHEEQEKAITAFYDDNDVFVSLPTGYGKSFIYQSIPVVATLLSKKPYTIFIISPLKALMADQVKYLNGLGTQTVRAVALTEQSDEHLIQPVHPRVWLSGKLPFSRMLAGHFRFSVQATAYRSGCRRSTLHQSLVS